MHTSFLRAVLGGMWCNCAWAIGLSSAICLPVVGSPLAGAELGVPASKGAEAVSTGHWSFQPLQRPLLPTSVTAITHPIDAFINARLDAQRLQPADRANKSALLRRVYFDLVGLPPPLHAQRSFCSDRRPGAYESLLNRLLASPHYGERYGRRWLDVVRYSDSAGYELDTFYRHAWRYRDYVIRSIADDKPFDRFVQEQLAADELWPGRPDLRYATGLLTVGPYRFEDGIYRHDVLEYARLTDATDTISEAVLGLSFGCARCHDHKFDPLTQRDYFSFHALLAGSQLWDEKTKLPPDNSEERKRPKNWILRNLSHKPVVHVLHRGDIDTPIDIAPPAFPRTLPGGRMIREDRDDDYLTRRSKLSRWLTNDVRALTARVIANRVWQWHFGRGLVATANDFGTQGRPPSHPLLLDYLAHELISHDWSLKHLHRLIMTSTTYQRSGRFDGQQMDRANRVDPQNTLLWRFPRRRLEAESIWDNLHATAGTINLKQYGPAIVPPDADVANKHSNDRWQATDNPREWSRRGIYVVVRRSIPFSFFETFNLNNPDKSCAARDATVISPQALTMLNGHTVVRQAKFFAGRLLSECGDRPSEIVRLAWRYAFGRPMGDDEQRRALAFLLQGDSPDEVRNGAPAGQLADRASENGDDWAPLGFTSRSPPYAERLVDYCLALMNANEFIYVD